MKRSIKKCIALIGGAVLLICLASYYLYFIQEKKIFQQKPLPIDYKFTSNFPFKEVFLETPDNAVLHALHYRVPGAKGVVLYFHGRGTNVDTEGNRVAKDFASRGHDVLIIDYRGFGKSRGKLAFPSLLSDAKLFYAYLLKQYSEDQITVFGRSLGTGIATYIASIHSPSKLILEAPYFSIQDMAAQTFPLFPRILIPYILKYPIRTDLWIQRVKCPIHIFHGTSDRVIGYDASTRLHHLVQNRKHVTLTLIQGGTHSTISSHPTFQSSLDSILSLP